MESLWVLDCWFGIRRTLEIPGWVWEFTIELLIVYMLGADLLQGKASSIHSLPHQLCLLNHAAVVLIVFPQ